MIYTSPASQSNKETTSSSPTNYVKDLISTLRTLAQKIPISTGGKDPAEQVAEKLSLACKGDPQQEKDIAQLATWFDYALSEKTNKNSKYNLFEILCELPLIGLLFKLLIALVKKLKELLVGDKKNYDEGLKKLLEEMKLDARQFEKQGLDKELKELDLLLNTQNPSAQQIQNNAAFIEFKDDTRGLTGKNAEIIRRAKAKLDELNKTKPQSNHQGESSLESARPKVVQSKRGKSLYIPETGTFVELSERTVSQA